jgi:hypothetical protein
MYDGHNRHPTTLSKAGGSGHRANSRCQRQPVGPAGVPKPVKPRSGPAARCEHDGSNVIGADSMEVLRHADSNRSTVKREQVSGQRKLRRPGHRGGCVPTRSALRPVFLQTMGAPGLMRQSDVV